MLSLASVRNSLYCLHVEYKKKKKKKLIYKREIIDVENKLILPGGKVREG